MPNLLPRPDADWLRGSLVRIGYTEDGIKAVTGGVDDAFASGEMAASARYGVREPTPLNLLIRIFALGEPAPDRAVTTLLPARLTELLAAAGLIGREGDWWVPRASLRPWGDLILAYDPIRSNAAADYVLGPGPSAVRLLQSTLRGPVRRILDLGCGCGIQALHAARHGDVVVATDLNTRAVETTAFNALLNGIENVEVRKGDLFGPVEGEAFDLILVNPPFVIGPGVGPMYFGSGEDLDAFCRRIVTEAPRYLAPEGTFQMVLDWVEVRGEEGTARLAEWVEGGGCDAWLIPTSIASPREYVLLRRRDRPHASNAPSQPGPGHAEWRRYFEDRDVTRVAGGYLMLRRTGRGRGHLSVAAETIPPDEPWGEAVDEVFAAIAHLDTVESDEAFLASRPRLNETVRAVRGLARDGGEWGTTELQLVQSAGLRRQVATDELILSAISRLDGERTVAAAIEGAAAELEEPEEGLRERTLRAFRRLLETGFLRP